MNFLWEELGSVIKLQNPFRNKDIISIGIDMNNKHISPTQEKKTFQYENNIYKTKTKR